MSYPQRLKDEPNLVQGHVGEHGARGRDGYLGAGGRLSDAHTKKQPQAELTQLLQNDMDQFEQFYKKYDRYNSGFFAPNKPDEQMEERSLISSVRPSTVDLVRTDEHETRHLEIIEEDSNELPNDSIYLPIQGAGVGSSRRDSPKRDSLHMLHEDDRQTSLGEDKPLNNSSAYVDIEEHEVDKKRSTDRSQEFELTARESHGTDLRSFQPPHFVPSQTTISPSLRYSEERRPSVPEEVPRLPSKEELQEVYVQNFQTEEPMSSHVQPNAYPREGNFRPDMSNGFSSPPTQSLHVSDYDWPANKRSARESQEEGLPTNPKRHFGRKQPVPEVVEDVEGSASRYHSVRPPNMTKNPEKTNRNAASQDRIAASPAEKTNNKARLEPSDSLTEFKRLEDSASKAPAPQKKPVGRAVSRPKQVAVRTTPPKDPPAAVAPVLDTEEQLRRILCTRFTESLGEPPGELDERTLSLIIDLAQQLKLEVVATVEENQKTSHTKLTERIAQLEAEKEALLEQQKQPPTVVEAPAEEEGGDKRPDTLMLKSKRKFEEEIDHLKKRIRKVEEDGKAKEARAKEKVDELLKKVAHLEQELKERDKLGMTARHASPIKPPRGKGYNPGQSQALNQSQGSGIQGQMGAVPSSPKSKRDAETRESGDRKSVSPIRSKQAKPVSKKEPVPKSLLSQNSQVHADAPHDVQSTAVATLHTVAVENGVHPLPDMDMNRDSIGHTDSLKSADSKHLGDLSELKGQDLSPKEETGSPPPVVINVNPAEEEREEVRPAAEAKPEPPKIAQPPQPAVNVLEKAESLSSKKEFSFKNEKSNDGRMSNRNSSRAKMGSMKENPQLESQQSIKSGSLSRRNQVGKPPAAPNRQNEAPTAPNPAATASNPIPDAGVAKVVFPNTMTDRQLVTAICRSFANVFPGVRSAKEKFSVEDFGYKANEYFRRFQTWQESKKRVVRSTNNNERVQNTYEDKVTEIVFSNGARRFIFPDRYLLVFFQNRDVKQTFPDNTVVYYYAEHDTTQITQPGHQVEVSSADLPLRHLSGRVPLQQRLQKDQVG